MVELGIWGLLAVSLVTTGLIGPQVTPGAASYWFVVSIVGGTIDACSIAVYRYGTVRLCMLVCGMGMPWWMISAVFGTWWFGWHPLNSIYFAFALNSLYRTIYNRY